MPTFSVLWQKEATTGVANKIFSKIHRKTHVPEPIF